MRKEEMTSLPVDLALPTTFDRVIEEEIEKEDWPDTDEDVDGEDAGFIRYNRAFVAKMSLTADNLKAYYNVIKNALLSYNGVKSRISWCSDTYNKGRIRLAKINVRGNSLMLYLALDPARYEGTKYRYRFVGFKKKFEYVPMLVKVRSKRGLRYALELIADLMANNGIAQGPVPTVAYAPERFALEWLMERNLVRVVGEQEADPEQEADLDEQPVAAPLPVPEAVSVDVACADRTLSDSEAIASLTTESAVSRRKGNKKAMVNIDVISRAFQAGDTVDLDALLAKKLVKSGTGWVKICARGLLDKSLVVKANDFSTVAIKMIVLTGGAAVKIK